MKKKIEYRNITGIKYAKDSEYMPDQFFKYTDRAPTSTPIKLKPVEKKKKKKVENDDTRDKDK